MEAAARLSGASGVAGATATQRASARARCARRAARTPARTPMRCVPRSVAASSGSDAAAEEDGGGGEALQAGASGIGGGDSGVLAASADEVGRGVATDAPKDAQSDAPAGPVGAGECTAVSLRAVVVAADELGYGDADFPLCGGGVRVSPLSLMAELGPSLDHLTYDEIGVVADALVLAFQAHSTQFRKSGEPYIIHPVAVSQILADQGMDVDSVVAGLLHDTVEDTDMVTFELVEKRYNAAVRAIVEGETKVSKIKSFAVAGGEGKEDVKAGDLQQMFIAMTEEVRVIIVKLADRLHNMRTLGALRPDKRRRIARETLLVFAPLAKLLGMHNIKAELEELCFMHSAPDAYAATQRRLDALAKTQEEGVLRARDALRDAFDDDQYLIMMTGTPQIILDQMPAYDVFERALVAASERESDALMGNGDVVSGASAGASAGTGRINGARATLGGVGSYGRGGGEARSASLPVLLDAVCGDEPLSEEALEAVMREVRNVAQVRVVLTPKFAMPSGALGPRATVSELQKAQQTERQICYHTMGLIHSMWAPVPGAVKDYIAMSKPNGYQSLHTTVLPRKGKSEGGAQDSTADTGVNGVGVGETHAFTPGADRKDDLFPIEIQIRTASMHALAEYGIAKEAARMYAAGGLRSGVGGGGGGETAGDGSAGGADAKVVLTASDLERHTSWLDSLREWQREFLDSMSARDFVSTVQEDLLGRRVFVFTPKGDVKNLPKGATVLDYAYHIHTVVGNTMLYAKVNSAIVSPDHVLQNADVVDIVRHTNATPRMVATHAGWLKHARTRSARHKLTEFIRSEAAKGNITLPETGIDGASGGDSGSNGDIGSKNGTVADDGGALAGAEDGFAGTASAAEAAGAGAQMQQQRPTVSAPIADLTAAAAEAAAAQAADFDAAVQAALASKLPSAALAPTDATSAAPSLEASDEAGAEAAAAAAEDDAVGAGEEGLRPEQFDTAINDIMSKHEGSSNSSAWVAVEVDDRNGLLSDMSTAISELGLSIMSYSGRQLRSEDGAYSCGIMIFEIGGETELDDIGATISAVDGVRGWRAGCIWGQREEGRRGSG